MWYARDVLEGETVPAPRFPFLLPTMTRSKMPVATSRLSRSMLIALVERVIGVVFWVIAASAILLLFVSLWRSDRVTFVTEGGDVRRRVELENRSGHWRFSVTYKPVPTDRKLRFLVGLPEPGIYHESWPDHFDRSFLPSAVGFRFRTTRDAQDGSDYFRRECHVGVGIVTVICAVGGTVALRAARKRRRARLGGFTAIVPPEPSALAPGQSDQTGRESGGGHPAGGAVGSCPGHDRLHPQ